MSEYLIQEETLTGIADAIRGKTGGTDVISVSNMAGKIAEIEAGYGGDIDALIDRSITEISSISATSIGGYAFGECSALTTVNFPVATSIGLYAFRGCSALTTVNFPVATSIGLYAFYNCSALTTVNFPVATSIGLYAFYNCSALTTVNFPVATSIEAYAFYNCSALTTVDFPVAKYIEDSAFKDCGALTTVNFPVATSIEAYAFYNCTKLKSLLLRGNNVCTFRNINAFGSTPIASGAGYIYVPAALIDQYKAATNWSTYAAQFRALEDYTVDGTVTGELDESKI